MYILNIMNVDFSLIHSLFFNFIIMHIDNINRGKFQNKLPITLQLFVEKLISLAFSELLYNFHAKLERHEKKT
jgi:hypothetical protein